MSDYKHDSNDISKACGFTENQLDEMIETLAKAENKSNRTSEVVEILEDKLSKRELAFLVAKLRRNSADEFERESMERKLDIIEMHGDSIPDHIKPFLKKLRETVDKSTTITEEEREKVKPLLVYYGEKGKA